MAFLYQITSICIFHLGVFAPKNSPSFPLMATPQDKPAHDSNGTWPIRDDDYSQDFEESTISSSECGCIRDLICCWPRNSNEKHGYDLLHQQQAAEEIIRESWVKEKAKKLKEISEVLARPRWKNFVRRFSIYGNGINNKKRRSTLMQFQYDPQGYKLNFDDGIHREVEAGFHDFYTRFAAPSARTTLVFYL